MKILIHSDSHGKLTIPPNGEWELFVHLGDICPNKKWQSPDEWLYQKEWCNTYLLPWLQNIQAKKKLILAANHDMIPEDQWTYLLGDIAEFAHDRCYHMDNEIIYMNGSSWNAFDLKNWGFGYPIADIHPYIHKIPNDCTILFTHEPAFGYRDLANVNIGSVPLCDRISELKNIKLHACGHCHESKGISNYNHITIINAACSWFEFDTVTGEARELF